jgi:hypothetical protein
VGRPSIAIPNPLNNKKKQASTINCEIGTTESQNGPRKSICVMTLVEEPEYRSIREVPCAHAPFFRQLRRNQNRIIQASQIQLVTLRRNADRKGSALPRNDNIAVRGLLLIGHRDPYAVSDPRAEHIAGQPFTNTGRTPYAVLTFWEWETIARPCIKTRHAFGFSRLPFRSPPGFCSRRISMVAKSCIIK